MHLPVRQTIFVLWLAVRFLLALINAKETAFKDENQDIKDAWAAIELSLADTQPIPIIHTVKGTQ